MITFAIILWTISPQIAVYLIIYTITGNLIAIYLTQELNKINQSELNDKADYNYALTHVRNHAESIAFFQEKSRKKKSLKAVLNGLFKARKN
jgi:putative ATP-binding cassette transporter